MKNIILLFIILVTFNILGQNTLKNNYYVLELPKETSFEKVNSTKEESSNVDLYKIMNTNNQQTKYLIYLMSNKLNKDIKGISDYSIEDYLKDIGKAEVLENGSMVFNSQEFYKVKLGLDNDVKGLLYITTKGSTLYRLLFMLPNEEHYTKHLEEMNSIFESNSLL